MQTPTFFDTSFEDINDKEHEITIGFVYYPGDPGKLTGPPEDCYPPEWAEIEIVSIKYTKTNLDVPDSLFTPEIDDELEAACWQEIERLKEDYADAQAAAEEDYWEWKRETLYPI